MTAFVTGIRSRFNSDVSAWVRGLTVALFVGGFLGGVPNFFATSYWPWQMPILAHRFLAGAAAAYVIGGLLTFFIGGWLASEVLMMTTFIYGLFLGGAALIQNDLIDWSQPIAWGFIGLVAPAIIITTAFLWSSLRRKHTPAIRLAPTLRLYLLVLAIVTTFVGLLVYFVPKNSSFVWPWAELKAWTTLDTRLVACMLLTVASGAFVTLWRNENVVARVFLPMVCAYCVVGGAGIALHAASTPAFVTPDLIYLVIFGIVLVLNLVFLWQLNAQKHGAKRSKV